MSTIGRRCRDVVEVTRVSSTPGHSLEIEPRAPSRWLYSGRLSRAPSRGNHTSSCGGGGKINLLRAGPNSCPGFVPSGPRSVTVYSFRRLRSDKQRWRPCHRLRIGSRNRRHRQTTTFDRDWSASRSTSPTSLCTNRDDGSRYFQAASRGGSR